MIGVVSLELGQHPSRVPVAQDEQVVQAFAGGHGADEPLGRDGFDPVDEGTETGVGVRPRRLDRVLTICSPLR